ncbi:hypothetical protein MXD63_38140, partial [Frankia sp. Cpl3]|nr:hypothetical protein [Frankia sp. Cpl3]
GLGYGYGSGMAMSQMSGMAAGGAQAVFQPGFTGTNPQQVRQEIARDGGFGYGGGYGQQVYGDGYAQQSAGMGGAQSVFSPGFAGTNPQQVRQEIAREGGFGYGGGYGQQVYGGGYGQQSAGMGGAQQSAGMGGAQSVFSPGFAGTNPQQVRQEIAREGGFGYGGGYGQQVYGGGYGQQSAGMGGA